MVTHHGTVPMKLDLLLPLGISFYTFQSMGYLIDVYNGKYKAEKTYLNLHCLFHFSSNCTRPY